jgi:hypothetical protein
MGTTLTNVFAIEAEWEHLARGTEEERACFCALGIRHENTWLTRAEDTFVKRVRDKVHLSGYRLAEWLAWNWWRLRFEPLRRTNEWSLAHRLAAIGGGYVWPNISITSDGERVLISAKPTKPDPREPLRYLADSVVIVRAGEFDKAVDIFVEQVLGQLRAEGVRETNLDRIWGDVSDERQDPRVALERRCEALLGYDADDVSATVLGALLDDIADLGEGAMIEVAADAEPGRMAITGNDLKEVARTAGFHARPQDAVRLNRDMELPVVGQVPAWERGVEAAGAVRQQLGLGDQPVDDSNLSAIAGVDETALVPAADGYGISFALDEGDASGRVVLRSKVPTGRRFELARLLGDRLTAPEGKLFPATSADTYRQKQQRAFAAELLCPFDILDAWLAGDYSEDNLAGAADRYAVSELLVRTKLVNHGRLDREVLNYQQW